MGVLEKQEEAVKIFVRRKHINNAERGNAQRCMIALAIKMADPSVRYAAARTNGVTISWSREDGSILRERHMITRPAARAIREFDNGKPVAPFSFKTILAQRLLIEPPTEEDRLKNSMASAQWRKRMKLAGKPTRKPPERIAGI